MDGINEQPLHLRGAGTNGHLLHLVVLCAGGSAQQVAQAMRQAHPQGFRLDDKAQYALEFRIIDSDVGLENIRESLEKTLLANLQQEDRLPFNGLPLVMVFAGQGDFLREECINRAKSLQCPFVDGGGGLDPWGWSRRLVSQGRRVRNTGHVMRPGDAHAAAGKSLRQEVHTLRNELTRQRSESTSFPPLAATTSRPVWPAQPGPAGAVASPKSSACALPPGNKSSPLPALSPSVCGPMGPVQPRAPGTAASDTPSLSSTTGESPPLYRQLSLVVPTK
ncbi:hypothetical protein HPB48_022240 [Haemaphysalis longicornis]|uniref:PG1 pseudoGTPase domain-containing protein n=1 Tax=Haemaphysalis longicornis TaxID=44386 RepID=A0A9J6GVQ8_HAELO|nr:hypothetical protein HPB48_022240 [Haemaphysalis longicornis]